VFGLEERRDKCYFGKLEVVNNFLWDTTEDEISSGNKDYVTICNREVLKKKKRREAKFSEINVILDESWSVEKYQKLGYL
jgi:hypothetical protein